MFRGDPVKLRFPLRAGAALDEALTAPLIEAGLQSATLHFEGAGLDPFRYVIPAPASDGRHVAWFSGTHAPEGTSTIELACATFGWTDGRPAIHCHAVWREPDGSRRGGHILPRDTRVADPVWVTARGFRAIRIETEADAETGFNLFLPHGQEPGTGHGIVARIAPNEDILTAVETIGRVHGLRDAAIHGTLGSLVGASFADGRTVSDVATEVLVRDAHLRSGIAAMELLVVDMQGEVHEGWLQRGQNPVCITFDLVLEAA
jgi:predicted DNA-binding protein with PD1-like motif